MIATPLGNTVRSPDVLQTGRTSVTLQTSTTIAGDELWRAASAVVVPFTKGSPAMHDPKLLAILDRREPVTLVRERLPIAEGPTMAFSPTLGMLLCGAAGKFAEETIDTPSYLVLAWNLTIVALLGVAARRALYQTNVLGGM